MPSEPQTESGRARPLSADEENAIRDFYARRTTRLAMGPSESIPRLLATLDRTRTASANIAALGVVASEEAASKAVAEVAHGRCCECFDGPNMAAGHEHWGDEL